MIILVPQLLPNSCWAAALEMYSEGTQTQLSFLKQIASIRQDVTLDCGVNGYNSANSIHSAMNVSLWVGDLSRLVEIMNTENGITTSERSLYYFRPDKDRENAHVVLLEKYQYNEPFNIVKTYDPWPMCNGLEYFLTVEGIEFWLKDSEHERLINGERLVSRIHFRSFEETLEHINSKSDSLPYPANGKWLLGRKCLKIHFLSDSVCLEVKNWLGSLFRNAIDIPEMVNLDYENQFMIPYFDENNECTAVRINEAPRCPEKENSSSWIINRIENALFLQKFSYLRPNRRRKKIRLSAMPAPKSEFNKDFDVSLLPKGFVSDKLIVVHFTQSDVFCLIEQEDTDSYNLYDPYGCLQIIGFKESKMAMSELEIQALLNSYLFITKK